MTGPPYVAGICLAGLAVPAAPFLKSQEPGTPKLEKFLPLGSVNRGASKPIVFVNPKDQESARLDLAGMWKATTYPDRCFYVWSAASLDGGCSFHTVRVSQAFSPAYIPERDHFIFDDDLSSADIDDCYVHIVWGDNR
ncbi:MAG: hypothetical protein ABJC09_13360 [Terriglobia bacterium]